MICPKCGKDMTIGVLGPSEKGSLFWAKEEYYNSKICYLFTERNAIKNGAIHGMIQSAVYKKKLKSWVTGEMDEFYHCTLVA